MVKRWNVYRICAECLCVQRKEDLRRITGVQDKTSDRADWKILNLFWHVNGMTQWVCQSDARMEGRWPDISLPDISRPDISLQDFSPPVISPLGHFAARTFRRVDFSLKDISPLGHFAARKFRRWSVGRLSTVRKIWCYRGDSLRLLRTSKPMPLGPILNCYIYLNHRYF